MTDDFGENPPTLVRKFSPRVLLKEGTCCAKSGVIARKIQPMNLNRDEARKIVETKLPHRTDNKEGYVAQFDAGNRVWLKKW